MPSFHSAASQKQVSFSARNSHSPWNIAGHGTLNYNTAALNLGGGFNTNSGIFTAPVSGLYLFSVSCTDAKETGTYEEYLGILVDGHEVSSLSLHLCAF